MAMNYFNTPMGGYYRSQMNNLVGGMNYTNPYQNVPSMTAQVAQNEFPCRPVTNREEAWAATLTDGVRPHIFTDFANKKIYVKYVDNSGLAKFNTFALEPEQVIPNQTKNNNIDVNSIQANIEQKFKEKIETLENSIKTINNEITNLKEGVKNAELPAEPNAKHISTSKNSK